MTFRGKAAGKCELKIRMSICVDILLNPVQELFSSVNLFTILLLHVNMWWPLFKLHHIVSLPYYSMFTRWVQLSHQVIHSFMSPQVTLCRAVQFFSTGSGAWLTTVRTQGTGAADIRTVWHQHSLLYTQVAVSLNVPLFVSGQVEHSFQNPNTCRHNLSLTRKCLVWTLNFSSLSVTWSWLAHQTFT